MRIIIIALLLITVVSCSNDGGKTSTPEVFKEKVFSEPYSSYRSESVLDAMYKDVVEKDESLQQLEQELQSLRARALDSLQPYDIYRRNCLRYYTEVESEIMGLKDTILQRRIRELVSASKTRFNAYIASHEALRTHIDSVMKPELARAHTVLKITKTLPALERYSKESLPSATTLQILDAEYQKAVDRVKNTR